MATLYGVLATARAGAGKQQRGQLAWATKKIVWQQTATDGRFVVHQYQTVARKGYEMRKTTKQDKSSQQVQPSVRPRQAVWLGAVVACSVAVLGQPTAMAQFGRPQTNAGVRLCQSVGQASPQLSQVATQARASTVLITTDGGIGSGFLIATDQLLTAYHVIRGSTEISARFAEQSLGSYALEVIGFDERQDLALLRLLPAATPAGSAANLPVLSLIDGATAQPKPTDGVVAIGNSCDRLLRAKFGEITALGKDISPAFPSGLIESTAPLAPGDSGGPALNTLGQVIGVVSAIGTEDGVLSSYIVPISNQAKILQELRQGIRREIPILGVSIRGSVISTRDDRRGLLVGAVSPGLGAASAGIRAGDVLVSLNGQSVEDFDTLRGYLKGFEVGDTVTVGLYRGTEELKIMVKLASNY
jgi:serine protease Do